MSTENRIREGLNKLSQAFESLAGKEIELSDIKVNSVSGNAIHGGKITLFRSTGITDNASKLVLLVDDSGLTVDAIDVDYLEGDTFAKGNFTVKGELVAETIQAKQIFTDAKHTSSIEFHPANGKLDMIGLQWKDAERTKLFAWRDRSDGFYSSNNIDLHRDASILIDNVPALSANRLGETIEHSSLRTVGVLENLTTVGDLNIDEGFVTWDSGSMRFAIGKETPNGQLSVASNEAEFIVDPFFDVIKVGTYTTSDLEIITDDTARISIKKTGGVNVHGKLGVNTEYVSSDVDFQVDGPVRIQQKKIQYNVHAPTQGSHVKGDITYNTEPEVGGYAGWICIEAGTPGVWKPFGKIED
jgi:hypothetical protein